MTLLFCHTCIANEAEKAKGDKGEVEVKNGRDVQNLAK